MIMRLTVMKKMTLMTIARRTTTQKRTISMTTMRKTTKTAKLSIQWTQTMAMNSLMNVLIRLVKTSMRLSGSSILCPNVSFLSKVVESQLQQLLLRRSKIVKTVRQRSLVEAVNPNVVLIVRTLKDPLEDTIDTKLSATRETQHLLDTTNIATTKTNIMMKSHFLRIDTDSTVIIIDQRMSCLTALNIVMVKTVCQLSRRRQVIIMELITEFCSTSHTNCLRSSSISLMFAYLFLSAKNDHLIPSEVTIPMKTNTILK